MKSKLVPICCCILLLFVCIKNDTITNTLARLLEKNVAMHLPKKNAYSKSDAFLYVKESNDATPLSKQDVKNLIYTVINRRAKTYTFYCPNEYEKCLEDVKTLSKDNETLTYINNYVHPFNSFNSIKTSISDSGEITLTVEYLYNEEEIKELDNIADLLIKENTSADDTIEDKIRILHDYIINHTKYDIERNNDKTSNYDSYKANGPFKDGIATCNGYTDAMAILLSKLGVSNYKVSTTLENNEEENGHIWNAVYLEGTWLHLDLTWDDPVSKNGKEYLQHKYFLITTSQLKEADKGEVLVTEHQFNQKVYLELKEMEETT